MLATQPAAHATRLLYGLALGNFAIGMGAFVVIGIVTPMSRDLGLSPVGASWAMTSYALTYAVASPLLVAVSGARDRRVVLGVGLALFALASVLSALAPSAAALYLARIVAALGAGLFTPTAAAVAVALSPPESRGRALSIVFGGLTLAQVIGIPIGSWLGYRLGWHAAFWTVAGLAALGFVCIRLVVPPGLRVQPTTLAMLGRTLRDRTVVVAVLFTASLLAAAYVVFTFLGPLIEWRLAAGPEGVAGMLILYGAGAMLGNALGGRATDRFGPERTLAALTLACVLVLPALTLVPFGPVLGGALVLAWGTAGWAFMVPQQARLVTLAADAQGVVLALNASCIYIGASLGSAISGAVVSLAGLSALGPVASVLTALALLHLWFSARLARGRGKQPARPALRP